MRAEVCSADAGLDETVDVELAAESRTEISRDAMSLVERVAKRRFGLLGDR